jgi:DNA-binding Lrp family transcriptional regulator
VLGEQFHICPDKNMSIGVKTLVVAYSLIKADSGKDARILAIVRRRKEVKEVALTYGVYDLIAKIEVDSPEELDSFIFDVLRCIPEIKETTTLITSRVEKGASTEVES